MLKRLSTRRFGPLPTWVEQRLAQASQQDLDDWADRVLEAQQLDECSLGAGSGLAPSARHAGNGLNPCLWWADRCDGLLHDILQKADATL